MAGTGQRDATSPVTIVCTALKDAAPVTPELPHSTV